MLKFITITILFALTSTIVSAQEAIAPLGYKAVPSTGGKYYQSQKAASKGTALPLPFIEDFTQSDYYPDTMRWQDRQAYINNNMCVDAISRGVATLDALGADGLPYEKQNKSLQRLADSLTSQPIDLSSYTANDSLYFSFYFQPEGNGFDPQAQDSLMLYFRRANATTPWTRVWRTSGSTLQPFRQVMIPITDASFFNADFQFRFVNKASMNNTDDTWNIDYIRLDANRNMNDTTFAEVAFVKEPSLLLNDYAFMPYHQFLANMAAESAQQHETSIRNNGENSVTVNYGYNAVEINGGMPLGSGSNSITINPGTTSPVSFPAYNTTISGTIPNQAVTYENRYYLQTASGNGLVENDTIVRLQHFFNYLAYDDGTPEKSYYLNMFPALPGKLAIEHRLNVPDTLKGVAIYFGRQVPLAYQKYFSLVVYKDIAFNGGGDVEVYREDLLIPSYLPGNNFWYYKFRKPIPLSSGKFYIGTTQPALGTSDSLYFGLDVNRTADNHVFFSVVNEWKKSKLPGAVMIRPLFGTFFPTSTDLATAVQYEWTMSPNPARDKITLYFTDNKVMVDYAIKDVQGRVHSSGRLHGDNQVDVTALPPGMYILQLQVEGQVSSPKKFIKI